MGPLAEAVFCLVMSVASFHFVGCGRRSVQGSVTKGEEVVMVSVKQRLTSVPGLGFMNLSVSRGRHYTPIGSSNPPTHFPILGRQEEVGGAEQTATLGNFALMSFLGKEPWAEGIPIQIFPLTPSCLRFKAWAGFLSQSLTGIILPCLRFSTY